MAIDPSSGAVGVVLSTVVATGRPELPTPTGTFRSKEKYSPHTFISPWPEGDPYWYPTVTVSWAMLYAWAAAGTTVVIE